MTLRKHIKAAGGDLAAAAAAHKAEHGRLPDRHDWRRAGVEDVPEGLLPPRGWHRRVPDPLQLVPLRLRASAVQIIEARTGEPASQVVRRLVDALVERLGEEQLLTGEQAARAAQAAEALGVEAVAEALREGR